MCVFVCVPCVTQDGGVVKRTSPVAVDLVDVGAILQQELAGGQRVLMRKHVTVTRHRLGAVKPSESSSKLIKHVLCSRHILA